MKVINFDKSKEPMINLPGLACPNATIQPIAIKATTNNFISIRWSNFNRSSTDWVYGVETMVTYGNDFRLQDCFVFYTEKKKEKNCQTRKTTLL